MKILGSVATALLLGGCCALGDSLTPDKFPALPVVVRQELENRHCHIPQPDGAKKRTNVVRGNFYGAGDYDWAILCERNGEVFVLVFRLGHENEPDTLGATPESESRGPDGRFLREISPANTGTLRSFRRPGHLPALRKLEHTGLLDEKGDWRTLYYYSGGKWDVVATTADRQSEPQ